MGSTANQLDNESLGLSPGVALECQQRILELRRKSNKTNGRVVPKPSTGSSGSLIRSLTQASDASHADCRQKEEGLTRKLGQCIKLVETQGQKIQNLEQTVQEQKRTIQELNWRLQQGGDHQEQPRPKARPSVPQQTNSTLGGLLGAASNSDPMAEFVRRNNAGMLASLLRDSNNDGDNDDEGEDNLVRRARVRHAAGLRRGANIL